VRRLQEVAGNFGNYIEELNMEIILDSMLGIRNISKYLNRVKRKWDMKVMENSKLWTKGKTNTMHHNC
jgi:hypothetical protein